MSGRSRLAAAAALAVLAGCATAPTKDYSKLAAARPRSILVVPVVNQTVDVHAPDYFLSTVPIPLAERGYYVFPVHLVKRMLEDDGLADASLVHAADPTRLAALFGADAVLYITITRWDARYLVLSTTVTVEFEYLLRDGHTGDVLWSDRERMAHSSDGGNQGGLAAAIVAAAIAKAAPSYLPLARRANTRALAYPGPGLLAGPYRPEHGKDYAPPAPPAAPAGPAPVPASASGDEPSETATR